ncbi:tRNA (guanosine(37)-N1)-methyltransferase TrmD [Thermodesulfobacteriota bacterium]
MVDFRILTIFPGIFESFLKFGNPTRAIEAGIVSIEAVDLRDFTTDRHKCTDDYPFGGGTGMIMKPEPVIRGIRHSKSRIENAHVLLMTPQGRTFDQATAEELARRNGVIIVCGRYEGIDERIRAFADEEISVGDYILSGGETAAMVVIDAICRLIPGVLGTDSHMCGDSFYDGLLEHPQYTRPREFENMRVPPILLEGHHAKIERWRKKQALARTLERRPDLLRHRKLDVLEQKLLDEIESEQENGDRA